MACCRSLFPFPAEPYTAAIRAGKRTAHHLVLYYTVRVDSSKPVRLSPEECDAAVWVPLDQLPALLDADHHGHYDPPPGASGEGGAAKGAAVALPAEYARSLCATRLPLANFALLSLSNECLWCLCLQRGWRQRRGAGGEPERDLPERVGRGHRPRPLVCAERDGRALQEGLGQ